MKHRPADGRFAPHEEAVGPKLRMSEQPYTGRSKGEELYKSMNEALQNTPDSEVSTFISSFLKILRYEKDQVDKIIDILSKYHQK